MPRTVRERLNDLGGRPNSLLLDERVEPRLIYPPAQCAQRHDGLQRMISIARVVKAGHATRNHVLDGVHGEPQPGINLNAVRDVRDLGTRHLNQYLRGSVPETPVTGSIAASTQRLEYVPQRRARNGGSCSLRNDHVYVGRLIPHSGKMELEHSSTYVDRRASLGGEGLLQMCGESGDPPLLLP